MYFECQDVRINLSRILYYKKVGTTCIYVAYAPGITESFHFSTPEEASAAINSMDKIAKVK